MPLFHYHAKTIDYRHRTMLGPHLVDVYDSNGAAINVLPAGKVVRLGTDTRTIQPAERAALPCRALKTTSRCIRRKGYYHNTNNMYVACEDLTELFGVTQGVRRNIQHEGGERYITVNNDFSEAACWNWALFAGQGADDPENTPQNVLNSILNVNLNTNPVIYAGLLENWNNNLDGVAGEHIEALGEVNERLLGQEAALHTRPIDQTILETLRKIYHRVLMNVLVNKAGFEVAENKTKTPFFICVASQQYHSFTHWSVKIKTRRHGSHHVQTLPGPIPEINNRRWWRQHLCYDYDKNWDYRLPYQAEVPVTNLKPIHHELLNRIDV